MIAIKITVIIITVNITEVMEEETYASKNIFAWHRYKNAKDNRYMNHQIDGNTGQRNTPNVFIFVCFICSVPGQCKQHCHVALYQFHDLAT